MTYVHCELQYSYPVILLQAMHLFIVTILYACRLYSPKQLATDVDGLLTSTRAIARLLLYT